MKRQISKFLNWKLIVAVILVLIIGIAAIPYVMKLGDAENRELLCNFFRGWGFLGWLMILAIQILQVIVAIIPGEPIEIFVGFVYGPWVGMLTCLLGLLIGTLLVFVGVKKFGKTFIDMFTSSEKLSSYSFLQNETKLESTIFILFFIPGTPKDVLTYFVPLTKIKMLRFLLLSTIARIPSVISSTYAGDTMKEGNWIATIIVFAITGALGILGIYLNNKFMEKKK